MGKKKNRSSPVVFIFTIFPCLRGSACYKTGNGSGERDKYKLLILPLQICLDLKAQMETEVAILMITYTSPL